MGGTKTCRGGRGRELGARPDEWRGREGGTGCRRVKSGRGVDGGARQRKRWLGTPAAAREGDKKRGGHVGWGTAEGPHCG